MLVRPIAAADEVLVQPLESSIVMTCPLGTMLSIRHHRVLQPLDEHMEINRSWHLQASSIRLTSLMNRYVSRITANITHATTHAIEIRTSADLPCVMHHHVLDVWLCHRQSSSKATMHHHHHHDNSTTLPHHLL